MRRVDIFPEFAKAHFWPEEAKKTAKSKKVKLIAFFAQDITIANGN